MPTVFACCEILPNQVEEALLQQLATKGSDEKVIFLHVALRYSNARGPHRAQRICITAKRRKTCGGKTSQFLCWFYECITLLTRRSLNC